MPFDVVDVVRVAFEMETRLQRTKAIGRERESAAGMQAEETDDEERERIRQDPLSDPDFRIASASKRTHRSQPSRAHMARLVND